MLLFNSSIPKSAETKSQSVADNWKKKKKIDPKCTKTANKMKTVKRFLGSAFNM